MKRSFLRHPFVAKAEIQTANQPFERAVRELLDQIFQILNNENLTLNADAIERSNPS